MVYVSVFTEMYLLKRKFRLYRQPVVGIDRSTRLQPVVLLTGQAAGILAALSVKKDKQPREVSIRDVQSALLEEKAYIMPLYDILPSDSDFDAIQKVCATGILKTTGEPFGWANRTWFYPDSTITVAEFTMGLNSFDAESAIVNDNKRLTEESAVKYINQITRQSKTNPIAYSTNPITKRELAKMLDTLLNPFSKEIGFDGHYK